MDLRRPLGLTTLDSLLKLTREQLLTIPVAAATVVVVVVLTAEEEAIQALQPWVTIPVLEMAAVVGLARAV